MKDFKNIVFIFGLTSLFYLTTSCNSQTKNKKDETKENKSQVTNKKDYELADEFLKKLRSDKVDTVIYYKRTCINCCDFYNFFWVKDGQKRLTKFYFDFDDMQTHLVTTNLNNTKIFDLLANNFTQLKANAIKENIHKNKNGTSNILTIDHYCYTQMEIYTKQDSILTDKMKDHDFDKYTDFGISLPNKNEKRETNDNYKENTNSKWNMWLTEIENEIAIMPLTIKRENETLRTKK
jgi:hypothetical protein